VTLWNVRKLPARLYAGVDGGSLRRTQHSWGRLGEPFFDVEAFAVSVCDSSSVFHQLAARSAGTGAC